MSMKGGGRWACDEHEGRRKVGWACDEHQGKREVGM